MYAYAYLVGNMFVLGCWALLFFLRPSSRRLMLCASLALAHGGLILANGYLRDYWTPEFTVAVQIQGFIASLEDYLFGFSFAGLAVCCFGFLQERTGARNPCMAPVSVVVLRLQVATAVVLLAVGALTVGFQVNSVHATVWVCTIGGIAILLLRPAWTRSALWCAFLGAVFFLFLYRGILLPLYPDLFIAWWNPALLAGFALYSIPVEEFLWAASVMFFVGPLAHWAAEWKVATVDQGAEVTGRRWLRVVEISNSY